LFYPIRWLCFSAWLFFVVLYKKEEEKNEICKIASILFYSVLVFVVELTNLCYYAVQHARRNGRKSCCWHHEKRFKGPCCCFSSFDYEFSKGYFMITYKLQVHGIVRSYLRFLLYQHLESWDFLLVWLPSWFTFSPAFPYLEIEKWLVVWIHDEFLVCLCRLYFVIGLHQTCFHLHMGLVSFPTFQIFFFFFKKLLCNLQRSVKNLFFDIILVWCSL